MAAKLGFEAIQYVLKKVLTKKGIKGIATIPGKAYDMRMKQLVDEMAFKMKALGYDINKVTQKEVQGLLDSAEALAKQKPAPESLIKGKKYTDERGRTWDFGTKDRPFPGFEPKVVPEVSGIDKALKSDFEKTIKKKDRPSIRLMKNFEKELTDIDLAKEGYNLQEISILKRARNVMKKEGQNPDDALQWVKSEMADDAGIEFEEFMPDFDWGDFPGKAEGGRVPLFKGKIIKGIASLGKKKKPKGKIWKSSEGETQGIAMGFDERELKGLDQAMAKGTALSDAMKKMGLDPASSKDYFKFEKLVSEGMVGFPNELKEQIIRAKYGDVVDQKLLNQMLADSNPQRISEVMGTIDEGLIMQQKGMHPDEIVETIKTSLKRKPQAEGGRIGMMYGGDPGFAFEYGGSWADWRDQHQHQMPITDYIKTKLPKERLPFRDMQSGGLAYMLGEPTYMKYGAGGGVGHAPWHKPSGQPQPQGQEQSPTPQVGGAQSPGRGQPNPMKGPQGLPSLAPRTMDPAFMQQQAMQKAMMGQQGQQRGQPRRGMAQGSFIETDPDFGKTREEIIAEAGLDSSPSVLDFVRPRAEIIQSGATPDERTDVDVRDITYGGSGLYKGDKWYGGGDYQTGNVKVDVQEEGNTVFKDTISKDDFYKLYVGAGEKEGNRVQIGKDNQGTWTLNIVKSFGKGGQKLNQGGRASFGLGSMSRRAFMKMMAGITGAGVAAGTGLLKLSKAAKVVPKVTETIARGADGMPVYITDLIEVVKAKGARDIIEGFKRSDYSTVHSYKGVDVIEDGAGNIKIKSEKGGVATDPYTGKSYEGVAQENHMQIDKGEWIKPTKSKKGIKTHDEYIEGSVRPDMDGKMKDFEEGLDEAVHLDFKKIADEIDTLIIKKTKKASGGLAHMLGE